MRALAPIAAAGRCVFDVNAPTLLIHRRSDDVGHLMLLCSELGMRVSSDLAVACRRVNANPPDPRGSAFETFYANWSPTAKDATGVSRVRMSGNSGCVCRASGASSLLPQFCQPIPSRTISRAIRTCHLPQARFQRWSEACGSEGIAVGQTGHCQHFQSVHFASNLGTKPIDSSGDLLGHMLGHDLRS